jgi:hypothetical protein
MYEEEPHFANTYKDTGSEDGFGDRKSTSVISLLYRRPRERESCV